MWALIEQDAIRQFVKAGFKNPADPWTKDTETQMNVSIAICADMAKRYQQSGINCVVDCFITLDPYVFDKWNTALKDITYKLIVFLPDVNKAIMQNNQRTGDTKLPEKLVIEQHEEFSAWRNHSQAIVIDTTTMDLPNTVQVLKNMA